MYNACNEACKQIIAADTLHLRKEHIEMLYSNRTYKRLIIAKELTELMKESQKSTDKDLKPLSFSEACEVMKIDMLEQIKENLEDIVIPQ